MSFCDPCPIIRKCADAESKTGTMKLAPHKLKTRRDVIAGVTSELLRNEIQCEFDLDPTAIVLECPALKVPDEEFQLMLKQLEQLVQ